MLQDGRPRVLPEGSGVVSDTRKDHGGHNSGRRSRCEAWTDTAWPPLLSPTSALSVPVLITPGRNWFLLGEISQRQARPHVNGPAASLGAWTWAFEGPSPELGARSSGAVGPRGAGSQQRVLSIWG